MRFLRNPRPENTLGAAQIAAIFFALLLKSCQKVCKWFVSCKIFGSRHSSRKNKHVGICEVCFCECCISEHGDTVRCLDLFGFFDGYSFDIDFCAAEKVYYCEAFDVFEAVGEENVYFLLILGPS